jgi:four helix bundle protein
MAKLQSFRELIVWQKAMALTKEIYLSTRVFPKEETYGLTSQLRRASVSVAANIAEGQAHSTRGEFIQFLGIAKGSIAELETLPVLSKELNFITDEDSKRLITSCEEISKLLAGLRKALLAKSSE